MNTEIEGEITDLVAPHRDESQSLTVATQQGRVDAVANLTMKLYERASMLQLSDEERKRLTAEFPDNAFRKGAAGDDRLIYIEHAHLRDRLNEVLGAGQWAIIQRSRWTEAIRTAKGKDGTRVYVEAMLAIRGCFIAEAIGDMVYYPNDKTNLGDAIEGARSAALRRCCKDLGVGLQAWKKEWAEQWWKRNPTGIPGTTKPAQAPQEPKASAEPLKPSEPPAGLPYPSMTASQKLHFWIAAIEKSANLEVLDNQAKRFEAAPFDEVTKAYVRNFIAKKRRTLEDEPSGETFRGFPAAGSPIDDQGDSIPF